MGLCVATLVIFLICLTQLILNRQRRRALRRHLNLQLAASEDHNDFLHLQVCLKAILWAGGICFKYKPKEDSGREPFWFSRETESWSRCATFCGIPAQPRCNCATPNCPSWTAPSAASPSWDPRQPARTALALHRPVTVATPRRVPPYHLSTKRMWKTRRPFCIPRQSNPIQTSDMDLGAPRHAN